MSSNSQPELSDDELDKLCHRIFIENRAGAKVWKFLEEEYFSREMRPRDGNEAMFMMGQRSVVQDLKERLDNGG